MGFFLVDFKVEIESPFMNLTRSFKILEVSLFRILSTSFLKTIIQINIFCQY